MSDDGAANIGVVGLAVMGVEPRPQPRQPRGQHGRGLQPLARAHRHAGRRASGGRVRRRRGHRRLRRLAVEAAHRDHHGAGRRRAPTRSSTSSPSGSSRATSSSTAATPTSTTRSAARRALRERGLNFVGAGISGGEEGALNGPSIMPGGSAEAYETLGPILASIAAVAEGEPCVTHVGTDGAGHFVKMIHNGIEYADMQLIAESYDLLRRVGGHDPTRSPTSSPSGTRATSSPTSSRSPPRCCVSVDAETGKPLVDVDPRPGRLEGHRRLDGAERGRASASRSAASPRRSSPAPSRRKPDAARGGPRRPSSARPEVAGGRRRASRTTCAQGALRLEGRRLRAGLRRDHRRRRGVRLGHRQGRDRQDLARRLHHPRPVPQPHRRRVRRDPRASRRCSRTPTSPTPSRDGEAAWRRVVATAALSGVPVPGFASALSLLRLARRPSACPPRSIQGQRDFFGAHTYGRIDKDGTFHTLWSGDRSEVRTDG